MAMSGAANSDNHERSPAGAASSGGAGQNGERREDAEEEDESGSDESDEEEGEEEEEDTRSGWTKAWHLFSRFPCRVVQFFQDHPFTFVEIMVWFLYYLLGIVYYQNVEGWSTQTCIYFITVTVSTIGYGQYGPTNDDSRIFTSFYCVFGILCVLTAINRAATRWLVKVQAPILDCFMGKKVHSPATKITFSLAVILMVLLVGCLGFSHLEQWDSAEAFYWTVTTMTTVGYGDLRVKNEATRQFGVFFIYLCMFVYSLAIHNIMTSFQDLKDRSKRLAAVVDIRKTGIFKRSMVANSLSEFLCEEDCSEFVLSTLLRMGKVEIKNDCEPIIKYWIQQRAQAHEASRISDAQHREMEDDADLARDSGMTSATGRGSGSRPRNGSRAEIDSKVDDFLAMAEQRKTVAALEKKEEDAKGGGHRYSTGSKGGSGGAQPVQNPLLTVRTSIAGDRTQSADGL